MPDMDDLLRQAQQMQSKMAAMQEELAKKNVEGSSGGGMVSAVANGKQEILSISIDKSVVDPEDIEMLQDLVTAAVNDALRRSRSMAEQGLASLTGSFSFPGFG